MKRGKLLAIIGAVIVISIAGIYLVLNKDKDSAALDDGIYHNTNPKDILDPNPDPMTSPILNDYVYSTIGMNSDIPIQKFGNSYLLVVRNDSIMAKSSVGTVHISRVAPSDFFPPVASGHVSSELSGARWEKAITAFNNWPSERKFIEGDYTLYVLIEKDHKEWIPFDEIDPEKPPKGNMDSPEGTYFEYDLDTAVWNDINLSLLEYPEGWLAENIERGWSTKWLRKEPYVSQINEQYGIDMNLEFFDNFRINQIISVSKTNNEDDIRRIRVDNAEYFTTLDGPVWHMDLEATNNLLEDEGYNTIKPN